VRVDVNGVVRTRSNDVVGGAKIQILNISGCCSDTDRSKAGCEYITNDLGFWKLWFSESINTKAEKTDFKKCSYSVSKKGFQTGYGTFQICKESNAGAVDQTIQTEASLKEL